MPVFLVIKIIIINREFWKFEKNNLSRGFRKNSYLYVAYYISAHYQVFIKYIYEFSFFYYCLHRVSTVIFSGEVIYIINLLVVYICHFGFYEVLSVNSHNLCFLCRVRQNRTLVLISSL